MTTTTTTTTMVMMTPTNDNERRRTTTNDNTTTNKFELRWSSVGSIASLPHSLTVSHCQSPTHTHSLTHPHKTGWKVMGPLVEITFFWWVDGCLVVLCGDSATVAIWSVFPSSNFNQGSFALPADKCNSMQCNAMQCNAMQCNAMQCNAMQCNVVQFFFWWVVFGCAVRRLGDCGDLGVCRCSPASTSIKALSLFLRISAIQCNVVQCNVVQCNVVQCNVVQCNAMWFNAMWFNAMQCNATWCGRDGRVAVSGFCQSMRGGCRLAFTQPMSSGGREVDGLALPRTKIALSEREAMTERF